MEHCNEKTKQEIVLLEEAMQKFQGRTLNLAETDLFNALVAKVDELKNLPERPLTVQTDGPLGNYSSDSHVWATPAKSKSFKAMFNLDRGGLNTGGFKDAAEFLRVIDSRRYDPRLDILASAVEGIPSSGGFSVPTAFAAEWLDASLPDEIVRKLCKVYAMQSETLQIPGWDGANMSGGATHGGFTMQFLAESAEATPQTGKLRKVELNAKMGAIYADASVELMQDGRNFSQNIEGALIKSIGYGLDRYCINGTGAGQPLGILQSPCKIQIAKESGQKARTIQYGNLKKMFARQLNPQYAVWLFNATSIPELMEQSVAVGLGGNFVPLLNEKDGTFTIFGRPVYFHPSMPALGSADDCAFVDFNFYGLGLRKDVWIDQTDAVRWLYRERSFRVLMRFDGQCTLDKAISPEHGDSLSPVVTLAERA